VSLNLVGSAIFLIAIGTLYGVTGTLNMADMAQKVAGATPESTAVLRSGALLLLVVFGLKAALPPLYFWLPEAYRAASAPVAALFAVMTKVGVYAILRLFTLIFGPEAGGSALVAEPWLLPVSLAAMVLGVLGVLAGRDLRTLVAYLVVASVGTLLTAVGLFDAKGIGAALFYLIHTTLITAGLFLLADLIGTLRGGAGDRFEPAAPIFRPQFVGALFFVGTVAAAGMPPLSGFACKIMILQAARESTAMSWVWGVVLATSLLNLLALSRAGSMLFWNTLPEKPNGEPVPVMASAPIIVLLAFSFLLIALGNPISAFTAATAEQLLEPAGYIKSVLGHLSGDAMRLAGGG
jgi:multicomponent K+:H+ antiporter subunit D